MIFLGRLLRVVFLLALVRFIVLAMGAWLRRNRAPAPARPAEPPAATDLVRDRVCNTFLPKQSAVRAVVAGREELFCSVACRDKALAAVSRAS